MRSDHTAGRKRLPAASSLAAALLCATCSVGGGGPDLPAGWAGARAVTVEQSACIGDAYDPTVKEALELAVRSGTLWGTFENAHFRCQQMVCAFRSDGAGATRILAQPCDMNPTTVPRCDCLYDVAFPLESLPAGQTVELYRRWDRYGATEEPAATLVDRQVAQ